MARKVRADMILRQIARRHIGRITKPDVIGLPIEFFKQSLKAGVPKRAGQLINDIKRAVERLEIAL